jgi:protein-disulfide isomerase
MPNISVNFGAAITAVLISIACSPANSTPPSAETATTAASPQKTSAAPTDPMLAAADHGRIAGDSTAKTWVIMASDFQCPFCREWHAESYHQFLDEYVRTGKVRVAYVNFPLGQHQNAVPAAEGAMCASAQNKFWQFHDALFDSQDRWATMPDMRPVLDSIATAVGVDNADWKQCVDTHRMAPVINADRDRASKVGVESTPTFLIGDQAIAGAQPMSVMRPVLDAVIAKNGSAPR